MLDICNTYFTPGASNPFGSRDEPDEQCQRDNPPARSEQNVEQCSHLLILSSIHAATTKRMNGTVQQMTTIQGVLMRTTLQHTPAQSTVYFTPGDWHINVCLVQHIFHPG